MYIAETCPCSLSGPDIPDYYIHSMFAEITKKAGNCVKFLTYITFETDITELVHETIKSFRAPAANNLKNNRKTAFLNTSVLFETKPMIRLY